MVRKCRSWTAARRRSLCDRSGRIVTTPVARTLYQEGAKAGSEVAQGRLLRRNRASTTRLLRRERRGRVQCPLSGGNDWRSTSSPRRSRRELARARNFGFIVTWQPLGTPAMALGASLENTLVVSEDRLLDPDGCASPTNLSATRPWTLSAISLGRRARCSYVSVRARRSQAQPCGAVGANGRCKRLESPVAAPPRGHAEAPSFPACRRPFGPYIS